MGSCFSGLNTTVTIKVNNRDEKSSFYIDTKNKKCVSTTSFSNDSNTKESSVKKLPLQKLYLSDISKITLIHSDNDVHSLREIFNLFD